MLKISIECSEHDFTLLYYTARQSYLKCINNKENEFLKDEINVPLNSIQVIEKDIKIVLSENALHTYQVEVSLRLYAEDREIGYYIYVEDETGNAIDDYLIFR